VGGQRIWLLIDLDPEGIEQAIVHEMVHIVTGGGHDDAFRRELRRVAERGCLAAKAELTLEQWHERAELAAETITREHRTWIWRTWSRLSRRGWAHHLTTGNLFPLAF
jgi:hypothetical protein